MRVVVASEANVLQVYAGLNVNSQMYPQYTQYIIANVPQEYTIYASKLIANVPQEYTIYASKLIAKCTPSTHNI